MNTLDLRDVADGIMEWIGRKYSTQIAWMEYDDEAQTVNVEWVNNTVTAIDMSLRHKMAEARSSSPS